MLNFPIPYSDELIYSTVARAGTHLGIVSPKQLLDTVFGNRHIIATIDLPNYLEGIRQCLPGLGYDIEQLAYQHTLLPIYAPFATEPHRKQCLEWMALSSQGSIHLTLGVVASRIKQTKCLRYCHACMQRQLAEHGEYFWQRNWQVIGADCCLEHGQLLDSKIERHSFHRHQFLSASPMLCPAINQKQPHPLNQHITQQVANLLDRGASPSATYAQWSSYYKKLAQQAGCNRGQQILYARIKELVLEQFPNSWLKQYDLTITDDQSSWLHSIFRKHRKSFSYLEHIITLHAFLPEGWSINDVLDDVGKIPSKPSKSSQVLAPSNSETSLSLTHRQHWLSMVKTSGTKLARLTGGSACYAWLYRHDKDWLLSTNAQYQVHGIITNCRVDWHSRDLVVTRKLISIKNTYGTQLNSPRWSKRWFLSKIEMTSVIEKNISKLPLTHLFFKKYCEDISAYQLRRIKFTISSLNSSTTQLSRWVVLRMAGLSDTRLRPLAKQFLNEAFEN